MTYRNGKIHRIEEGLPETPRMYHLSIHRACDRFLASRGVATGYNFRNSDFIFGAGKRRKAK